MKASKVRMFVLIAFLLFMSWVGYRHQVLGGGAAGAPTVDALCPFGGLESLYSYLTTGGWLRRVAPSALALLGGVLLMTLITGRTFCGWICPLGTIAELSSKSARRLGIRQRELPGNIDQPLRYLKYLILIVIIAFTWKLGTLAWRDYDPWVAWMHLSAGWSEIIEKPWSYVVLFMAVIVAGLYIERFWCRYLCPLGAFLALFQKISLIKVRRSEDHCIHCHLCSKACPVRLDPESVDVMKSAECIACGRCVEKCPEEKALFFGTGSWKFKTLSVGLAGLIIFFGSWAVAKTTGFWQTWASPTSYQIESNPADAIYGWMTVTEIAETLDLSVQEVIEGGRLDSHIPVDTPLKEIEGVDDEEVKDHLAQYLQITSGNSISRPASNNPDEIRGSMTMEEISKTFGLEGKDIFRRAGWPEDTHQDTKLKGIADEQDLEIQSIREAVSELLKEKQ